MRKIVGGLMVAAFAMVCLIFVSCSKDLPKNSECDILSAWVEGTQYEQYFYQNTDMRNDNIASTTAEIVFYVKSLSGLPQMPVYFSMTEGATISPANGSLQDFSSGAVAYTVTSEDGEHQRIYSVVFKEQGSTIDTQGLYSFEHVEVSSSGSAQYHVFYELNGDGSKYYLWASGNEGVSLVHSNFTADQYPTHAIDDGYQGKALCLTTIDAGSLARMANKPIAAGNLYWGTFDVSKVMTQPLKSTVFGVPVNREPLKVTGYYKYQPGQEFTDANMNVIADRVDEANIYAVFFRNHNDAGESIHLYGDSVFTSPFIVTKAQVASLPATNEWIRFEMTFEGGDVDANVLATYGYSMTLVFSSSKGGDSFEGAIGSTLYVDEVEVTYKTNN